MMPDTQRVGFSVRRWGRTGDPASMTLAVSGGNETRTMQKAHNEIDDWQENHQEYQLTI